LHDTEGILKSTKVSKNKVDAK